MHLPLSMLILFGIFAVIGVIWTISKIPAAIVALFDLVAES